MHIDADDLALLALGEAGSHEQAHVNECAQCRSQMESVAGMSRPMVDTAVPIRPPAHVWAGIESAIRHEARTEPATAVVGPHPVERGPVQKAPTPVARRRMDRARTASTKPRFSGLSLLGAAAAGAVLAGLGAVLSGGIQSTDDGSVLASVQLESLDDSVSSGTAQIVERDGQRVLQVQTGRLPELGDGYLEVWLLQQDAPGMVTIGLLDQGGQEFVLPEGLSTDTFGVVDVSVEHYDGDPSHGGDSLWRGPIAAP